MRLSVEFVISESLYHSVISPTVIGNIFLRPLATTDVFPEKDAY